MLSVRNISTRRFIFTVMCIYSSCRSSALNICIIAGSTRTSGPPRPILSDRVTAFIANSLHEREQVHKVTIVNAKDGIPLMEKPHFAYSKSQVPKELERISKTIDEADAFITITPEYNHSPCPGLMNIMNHFGSSSFSFIPSGIVSYSAGQWGGTRAAHALRPFLSELGCLPVSAMVHIPLAANVLDESGDIIQDEERWKSYVDRMLRQLEWWGMAAKNHRLVQNPFEISPAFTKSPTERNAPT
jgi:chromate reductase, NAD(P)H dehydrogenase (quinone)